MSRTIELVLYVYARPAGPTEQESLAVFKREVERVRDIETLVAMRFGDFRAALDESKRSPALVRLRARPWAAKKLRGKFEGVSRDRLWERVRGMEGNTVDVTNAQHGAEVPRAFVQMGLVEQEFRGGGHEYRQLKTR